MVIDASVALKLFLEEDGSAQANRLFERNSFDAPELVLAEVANGLWKAHRRGVLSGGLLEASIVKLTEIFDTLHPVLSLTVRAVQIAAKLDHPVYDCIYLACAEQYETTLITADRRLLLVVEGSPWERYCRSLSDID